MGLREDFFHVPVRQLALRELLTARPGDKVRTAVKLMKSKRLGCVIVVDDAGRPVGKFTEGLLMKLLNRNPAGMDDPISKHMSPPHTCVKLDDPVVKVLDAMERQRLRFVVVVDDAGKAIALTGQKGLMEYIAEHFPRLVKVQMMESKLYMDQREGA